MESSITLINIKRNTQMLKTATFNNGLLRANYKGPFKTPIELLIAIGKSCGITLRAASSVDVPRNRWDSSNGIEITLDDSTFNSVETLLIETAKIFGVNLVCINPNSPAAMIYNMASKNKLTQSLPRSMNYTPAAGVINLQELYKGSCCDNTPEVLIPYVAKTVVHPSLPTDKFKEYINVFLPGTFPSVQSECPKEGVPRKYISGGILDPNVITPSIFNTSEIESMFINTFKAFPVRRIEVSSFKTTPKMLFDILSRLDSFPIRPIYDACVPHRKDRVKSPTLADLFNLIKVEQMEKFDSFASFMLRAYNLTVDLNRLNILQKYYIDTKSDPFNVGKIDATICYLQKQLNEILSGIIAIIKYKEDSSFINKLNSMFTERNALYIQVINSLYPLYEELSDDPKADDDISLNDLRKALIDLRDESIEARDYFKNTAEEVQAIYNAEELRRDGEEESVTMRRLSKVGIDFFACSDNAAKCARRIVSTLAKGEALYKELYGKTIDEANRLLANLEKEPSKEEKLASSIAAAELSATIDAYEFVYDKFKDAIEVENDNIDWRPVHIAFSAKIERMQEELDKKLK